MKQMLICSLAILPLLLIWGCDSESVVDPEELTPPSNLRITDIPLSGGQMNLSWDAAVAGDAAITGYRVYAHTLSLQSWDDTEQLAPYVKEEVGSATQSALVDLGDSYTYYYVHVRAVTEEDDLSRASNELLAIARPADEGALIYEFASTAGNPSGYDLSEGEAVSMATSNQNRYDRVDFFLGYSGGDTGGGDLYLWSPKDVFDSYENTAGFMGVSSSFDELDEVPVSGSFSDHVAVNAGTVIAIKITDENAVTNYAKLEFTSVDGMEPDRTVVFQWAYQPEPGRPELVPNP